MIDGSRDVITALAALPIPVRTAESLLEREPSQLAKESGLSMHVIESFKTAVARQCAPKRIVHRTRESMMGDAAFAVPDTSRPFNTASELLKLRSKMNIHISTGSLSLDNMLDGNILIYIYVYILNVNQFKHIIYS